MAVLGVLTLAPNANAQSRQLFSLQGAALLTSLQGDAFDVLRVGTGFGGEVQLRVNPGPFSLGAGLQLTKHSSTSQGLSNKVSLSGLFLEPRYAIAVSSRIVRPYVAGRVALMSQKTDLGDLGGTLPVKANALAYGVGGGFVARINGHLGFDLGAALTSLNFGDFKYRDTGATSGLDAGSGTMFVLKAGFNVGLGRD
ncbi:MAG TPA: outer membrane beta-barrel protein [Gemmatimonadaceae bacterium]|nr:outer membrane beta-barrel protein [Gemmatimonadaceae bacterium]